MSTIRTITMLTLAAALLTGGLAGCSPEDRPKRHKQPGQLRVLCSTYPVYLFTHQVTAGCEGVTVEMMLPAGVGCPHDYNLTPGDMRKLAAADVLVINGLGMDNFMLVPLRQANKTITVIDTSDGLVGLVTMSACSHGHDEHDADEEDEEDDDADGHHHDHSCAHDHGPVNPHLFASPRMAATVVRNLAFELSRVDPANAEQFMANGLAYAKRLDALAGEMETTLRDAPQRKIVTEHAVFDYLARDCGLEIAAVIEEIPGQDPVAVEMQALMEQIRASGASVIFFEPKYPLDGPQKPSKVARTLADELRLPVEMLDPVALGPDNPPADYYETRMRANLATLVRVLGKSQ